MTGTLSGIKPRQHRYNIPAHQAPLKGVGYAEPMTAHKFNRRVAFGLGLVMPGQLPSFSVRRQVDDGAKRRPPSKVSFAASGLDDATPPAVYSMSAAGGRCACPWSGRTRAPRLDQISRSQNLPPTWGGDDLSLVSG